MRIAIISDIHGNCFAFDAVVADLKKQRTDQVVCLGDAIQGGAQPTETVARLRDLGCPVVMGNADAWLLTGEETGREAPATERMLEIREWSLAQLSAEDRAFIESFQPTIELPLGKGGTLLCFHGSPTSFDDVILPDTPLEEVRSYLASYQPAIMTGGHTHLQFIRQLGDTFFFNPGSVGVAYDHQQPDGVVQVFPWAEYAILTVEGGLTSLEFRRVPLDTQSLVRTILSSGRPYAESMAAQHQTR